VVDPLANFENGEWPILGVVRFDIRFKHEPARTILVASLDESAAMAIACPDNC
jgi:hypothetical protein